MKHKHYWNYEHAVWQAGDGGEIAVGRYCSECGKMQTAQARRWHSLPKSYAGMRETLEKSIKSTA